MYPSLKNKRGCQKNHSTQIKNTKDGVWKISSRMFVGVSVNMLSDKEITALGFIHWFRRSISLLLRYYSFQINWYFPGPGIYPAGGIYLGSREISRYLLFYYSCCRRPRAGGSISEQLNNKQVSGYNRLWQIELYILLHSSWLENDLSHPCFVCFKLYSSFLLGLHGCQS